MFEFEAATPYFIKFTLTRSVYFLQLHTIHQRKGKPDFSILDFLTETPVGLDRNIDTPTFCWRASPLGWDGTKIWLRGHGGL
jgi:hypothetical protein